MSGTNNPFPPDTEEYTEWERQEDADRPREFWDERDALARVRDFARARQVSPWAMLGVVLTRVVARTPPWVMLPSIVGAPASINLFVGIVGRSGSGKGVAEAAASEALSMDGGVPPVSAGAGSGEGISHLFARRSRGGDVEQVTESVILSVPEIDSLTALHNRRGSTLLPELRKAWTGEALGFSYVDPSKRIPVEAHRYRLCLVVGIQPGRAGDLLGDADGGTPQRFLWLPATDPQAPDTPPSEPDAWPWKLSTWNTSDWRGRVMMPVCATAVATIQQNRLAALREEPGGLEGHAYLAQLKVAAALSLLDSRQTGVTDEDWSLAARVMRVSDATRARVVGELQRLEDARNTRRGESEAVRAEVISDRAEQKQIQRAVTAIRKHLGTHPDEWVTKSTLRRTLRSGSRHLFEEVVGHLIAVGQIECSEANSNDPENLGRRFRLLSTEDGW